MSKHAVIQKLEKQQLKEESFDFRVGDTVKVHTRVKEGSKERVQVFEGTVIARKGSGLSETFSLHRVAYGEGMERVFLLHSPRITKIEIVKRGRVRRAKLYYLRGKKGKKAKVQGDMAQMLRDSQERKRVALETSQNELKEKAVQQEEPIAEIEEPREEQDNK